MSESKIDNRYNAALAKVSAVLYEVWAPIGFVGGHCSHLARMSLPLSRTWSRPVPRYPPIRPQPPSTLLKQRINLCSTNGKPVRSPLNMSANTDPHQHKAASP